MLYATYISRHIQNSVRYKMCLQSEMILWTLTKSVKVFWLKMAWFVRNSTYTASYVHACLEYLKSKESMM